MCAHGESVEDLNAAAVRDAAGDSNISPAVADKLTEPLAELRRAANNRNVEQICAAHLALRRAAAGVNRREAFALADAVLGQSAMNLIVSAYSHRHCFMCDGGSVPCEQCDAGGRLANGRTCPGCEGLGLLECGFCSGTGWADRDTTPPEIATAVMSRQLDHVRTALDRTVKALGGFTIGKIRSLPLDKRRAMVARLMQLHSRLGELAGSSAIDDDEEQVRLGAMVEKIRTELEMLKKH